MGTVSVYYSDELVTLHLGSCLEELDWLTADVLVTDPPYGIGGDLSMNYMPKHQIRNGMRQSTRPHAEQTWDTTLDARDDALRLWGDRPYACFGSPARIDAAPPHRRAPLIWWKAAGGMDSSTWPWHRDYEFIYVNGDGWAQPSGEPAHRSGILKVQYASVYAAQLGHPTPKPVPLMELIVRTAPPGVITDPFTGSGSTLIAARNLGRHAIGVELEERYAEVAARRLSQGVLDLDGV